MYKLSDVLCSRIVKQMEMELYDSKDDDIDERILDIMRVQATFDGKLDEFERWVNERK